MMKVGQAYAFLFLDENENLINYLTSEKNYMTLFSNSFSFHAKANELGLILFTFRTLLELEENIGT